MGPKPAGGVTVEPEPEPESVNGASPGENRLGVIIVCSFASTLLLRCQVPLPNLKITFNGSCRAAVLVISLASFLN